ncbi:MAG: RHS repeat-associated core domain-containing protein [Anaerolineae bacterium]|nr:RHS repeat-associated core domain-containing protein [Anaerolineae bacterium]
MTGLGSSSVLQMPDNNVAYTWYLPFGGYRPGSAPTQTGNGRDFTGQRENMELGLLYYNARFYVPGLGRFASADTIIHNPTNPQSYNRYSYVRNRPLNMSDPTGHKECGGPFDPACYTPSPTSTPTPTSGTPAPVYTSAPQATPAPIGTPSLLEQQILASTILLEFTYQGADACPIGSILSCQAFSHGTIVDDQTLLSHNHFDEFKYSISRITLYDSSGNLIQYNGSVTQRFTEGEQSSTFEFDSSVFSGQTSATFENNISSGVQVGDEVAVIDWDGANPGSTKVVWANVMSISTYDGVPSLQVDVNVNKGASGGGIFFNGSHIANNTNTGLYGSYSWAAINP